VDVFGLRETVVEQYSDYIRTDFLHSKDPAIDRLVQESLDQGRYWPEPLVQLNPAFEPGDCVDDLVARGVLAAGCRRILGSLGGGFSTAIAEARICTATASLDGGTADDWHCMDNSDNHAGIDMSAASQWQYQEQQCGGCKRTSGASGSLRITHIGLATHSSTSRPSPDDCRRPYRLL
jgi:hypothetical protein